MSSSGSPITELGHVAKGSSLNFLGAISRNLLGFVVVYVLTQFLSASDVGIFFLGMSIVMFVRILIIGGLDQGLRRFISIAHGRDDGDQAWNYFITSTVLVSVHAIILCAAMYVFSDYLGEVIFKKEGLSHVIRGLIPFIIMYSFAEIFLSVTHGYKHMKYWVICLDILNGFLRVALVVLFSLMGFGLDGAIAGYVIAILATVLLAFFYFKKVMPDRKKGNVVFQFKSLTDFSIPVAISKLVFSGNGLLETMLLGYFLAASEVGIYTVALKITVIGAIILSSFNTMFAPMISQMYDRGRTQELKDLFTCITRWTFSFSLPIFSLVAWFAVSISAVFGEEYIAGASCIVALCIVRIINSVTGASGNLLLMSGHTFINLWTNMVGLVLSVVLNILLIPVYGILGTAIAVGVAVTAANVIRIVLAWKKLHMHPYDWDYWKPMVSVSAVILVLMFFGDARVEIMGLPELILQIGLYSIFYLSILFLLGLNETDRYALNKIVSRFR